MDARAASAKTRLLAAVDARVEADLAPMREHADALRSAIDTFEQVASVAAQWRQVASLLPLLVQPDRGEEGDARRQLVSAGLLRPGTSVAVPTTTAELEAARERLLFAVSRFRSFLVR
jgi:hypothetical protein